jgi:hypothetical protein
MRFKVAARQCPKQSWFLEWYWCKDNQKQIQSIPSTLQVSTGQIFERALRVREAQKAGGSEGKVPSGHGCREVLGFSCSKNFQRLAKVIYAPNFELWMSNCLF